jgi:chorismate mutase
MASTTLTFTLEGRDRLSRVLDNVGDSAKNLEKRLVTASAAIPAAAALAPLAAQAGAAAVAVAAFGAAIVPQIGALSDASQAQKKYEDAVTKSGRTSQAAITAQLAFQEQIAKMPSATRQAAAGLTTLKREYQSWSDGLAKDTMPVFTKGLAIASAALPKFTPLVKGASVQLDRLMTAAGGALATPGVDQLMGKFSTFATTSLRQAVDGVIHFTRTLNTGKIGGSLSQFMDYARQQGPLLADTLKNVATAAVHLLTAASGVGVSVLQLANAAAKLVASLPPGFITVLMQIAIAIRAVKLAGSGIQLLAGGFSTVASSITTMRTAAAGASGRVAGMRSALSSLSTGAKLNVAAVGIGLLAVALVNLSKIGKQAPPDVDKLTTSLGNLASTGKTSGEAARVFGSNLKGLYDGIRNITDASTTDKIQQGLVKVFSLGMADSTPNTEAKQKIDAIDTSLANLVQGGKADLAAVALKQLSDAYAKGGHDVGDFKNRLDKYKSALADQKFEQDLAAQSMGLFGAQAQKTQAALAEQQRSADGLRQSIMALNEAHRSAFDADTKFAAAVDNAAKSLKDNGKTLDINTEKGRANRDALSQLASATEESAAQARANGASWSTVSGIYDKGRKSLIDNAYAMTGNRKEAKALADQLLRTPDKTARLKGNLEDLKSKLDEAAKRLKNAPSSKQTAIRGNIDDLKFKISEAQRRLNAIDGKTAVTYVVMKTTTSNAGTVFHEGGNYASGGPIGFPGGGPISGPGTGTSDSIPIMASNGEYVINARSTAKYRSLIEAINAGTLGAGRGMPGAGAAVAQGLMSGMAGATSGVGAAARTMAAAVVSGVKGELQIASPSKKMKALAADIGRGLIVGLTGSQDKIKSVSADLAKDIRTAFSGKKESNLVAYVNRQTGKLLAAAKKRDAIAAKIAEAKQYASDVTTAARESAGLSNLGMQPEEVTAGGIKAGLAGKLAQIKQFTKYVDILAKKGLNKSLLRQILNMGPDAGYAYASALAGADKNTFKSINSLQGQLDKSTTTLGQVGADGLYDAGKNAGKGFLKGLEGQQKDIEKLMMSIAQGMQKAIKKALGIKSPSTVMAQLGAYSTHGLARGLVDGLPVLDQALDVVTGRVAGARPVLGRPAGRASGGGVVINLNVEVRPGADAQAVWREIRQGLLSLKRGNGGGDLGLA